MTKPFYLPIYEEGDLLIIAFTNLKLFSLENLNRDRAHKTLTFPASHRGYMLASHSLSHWHYCRSHDWCACSSIGIMNGYLLLGVIIIVKTTARSWAVPGEPRADIFCWPLPITAVIAAKPRVRDYCGDRRQPTLSRLLCSINYASPVSGLMRSCRLFIVFPSISLAHLASPHSRWAKGQHIATIAAVVTVPAGARDEDMFKRILLVFQKSCTPASPSPAVAVDLYCPADMFRTMMVAIPRCCSALRRRCMLQLALRLAFLGLPSSRYFYQVTQRRQTRRVPPESRFSS